MSKDLKNFLYRLKLSENIFDLSDLLNKDLLINKDEIYDEYTNEDKNLKKSNNEHENNQVDKMNLYLNYVLMHLY